MQIPDIIKPALDYIEENLKAEITAEELARMANYSTYHYYRLFSSVMDSSVSNYILKRRLDHALSEIADGKKAIDVVLDYGFDTYAGFYKAFKKMYGCSPKKYLSIYREHNVKKPEVAIMYTHKELRNILGNWDIEKGLKIEDVYILHGTKLCGNVWKVGQDFFLKTESRDRLMKNLKVVKALAEQGVTSALPIPTKTGSEYVDGKELFILTQGIMGSPLSNCERYGDSRIEFGIKYGQSIARLHKALKSIQKDVLLDEVNLYQNVIGWALPNVRQQNKQWNMGIEEYIFDDYIDTFGKLYDKLPMQLIHRDPNPGNILFNNGKVSGFIDFDLSEVNIRLWDVCYCATGILSESSDEVYDKWIDILSGVLNGYDDENKLTCEEKQAVLYVIYSITMICMAYFESLDEYRVLAKTSRKMLIYFINNRDRITQIMT